MAQSRGSCTRPRWQPSHRRLHDRCHVPRSDRRAARPADHCLASSDGEDAARIALRVRARETGAPSTEWLGGDNDNPDIEAFARLAARYTYLPSLRDAQADLRPGRINRLVMLLDSIARDPADREATRGVSPNANAEIRDIDPGT